MDSVLLVIAVVVAVLVIARMLSRRRHSGSSGTELASPSHSRPGNPVATRPTSTDQKAEGWGTPEQQGPQSGEQAKPQPPPPIRERKPDETQEIAPAEPPTPASIPSGTTAMPEVLDDVPSLPEPQDALRGGEVADVPLEPARFSAYYPREVTTGEWLPLVAYVFRRGAAELVEADARAALKDRQTDYRPVSRESSTEIAEGALVTATPELPGFQFNPPSASVAFYESWHALPFKLRAISAPADQAANGRLTFTIEGVIVADLPLSVYVSGSTQELEPDTAAISADPYESIFCSYSHDDAAIVERLERAYRALGLEYLRDVTVLRSGEAWNARLLALIDEADIFQLFWSSSAASSPYVQQEWQHALSLGRPSMFIRPVYWEQPMPDAPEPLRHVHFHYDAELASSH